MARNVIINENVYSDVPYVDLPLANGQGDARFWDASGANGVSADLVSGKTLYGPNGEVQGGMIDNGDVSGTISTKAGTVNVPAGKTSGGAVKISDAEQAKIIASNIKKNVTILGVTGNLSAPTVTQDSQTHGLTIS